MFYNPICVLNQLLQGTKKTSHNRGDVTKTQNIDMKSGCLYGCRSQHFSIFLRGCKQANLSTIMSAKVQRRFYIDKYFYQI